MSEVKAGDVAWFRGRYVEWEDGSRRASQVLSDTAIPDSPALPAVARWLAETSDAGVALDKIDAFMRIVRTFTSELRLVATANGHETTFADAMEIMGAVVTDDHLAAFRRLVAALATDAADGGAG